MYPFSCAITGNNITDLEFSVMVKKKRKDYYLKSGMFFFSEIKKVLIWASEGVL